MTFTFGSDLSDNLDFVRFKTGDTVQDESFLTDELITSLLAVSADRYEATIAAVRYIITQLARPDFKADWLEVKNSTARAGYVALLADLKAEFGLDGVSGGLTGKSVRTYRGDSATVQEPDYTGGRSGAGGVYDPLQATEYTHRRRWETESE